MRAKTNAMSMSSPFKPDAPPELFGEREWEFATDLYHFLMIEDLELMAVTEPDPDECREWQLTPEGWRRAVLAALAKRRKDGDV